MRIPAQIVLTRNLLWEILPTYVVHARRSLCNDNWAATSMLHEMAWAWCNSTHANALAFSSREQHLIFLGAVVKFHCPCNMGLRQAEEQHLLRSCPVSRETLWQRVDPHAYTGQIQEGCETASRGSPAGSNAGSCAIPRPAVQVREAAEL